MPGEGCKRVGDWEGLETSGIGEEGTGKYKWPKIKEKLMAANIYTSSLMSKSFV